jgi:hypothetical protein
MRRQERSLKDGEAIFMSENARAHERDKNSQSLLEKEMQIRLQRQDAVAAGV